MDLSPEEQLRTRIRKVLEQEGEKLVQYYQDAISDPYPPSSEPATRPHRRTGDLKSGIHYQVDEFADGQTLTIISDADYSIYLRDGTSRMEPRNFMGETDQEGMEVWIQIELEDEFAGPLKDKPAIYWA